MTSVTEPTADASAQPARIEQVVIAADDSYGAIAAADWVADRLQHAPASIRVVVVAQRRGERSGPSARDIGDRVAWRMREYLETRAPGNLTTTRIVDGDPAVAVRHAAEEADLLVIGCNRHGFWQHVPIATRSTRVAELVVRPTVVVPATWSVGPGPIVAAISERSSDAVVDWAAADAAATGRELVLLHCSPMQWSPDLPALPTQALASLRATDRQVLAAAAERAALRHPDVSIRTAFDSDGVVPVLRAHSTDAAALVLGIRGGAHPRLGPVLRGVLGHATCPIVLIPSGGDA